MPVAGAGTPSDRGDGLLIQALVPTAAEISVKISSTGKKYPMELADEAGFFAGADTTQEQDAPIPWEVTL
ncbi:MAG: GlgB N-terminal domain-containing protein [Enterocloster bolteae]